MVAILGFLAERDRPWAGRDFPNTKYPPSQQQSTPLTQGMMWELYW